MQLVPPQEGVRPVLLHVVVHRPVPQQWAPPPPSESRAHSMMTKVAAAVRFPPLAPEVQAQSRPPQVREQLPLPLVRAQQEPPRVRAWLLLLH